MQYASSVAGHLRRHLKTLSRKKWKNVTNVTLLPHLQAIWVHILQKHGGEKCKKKCNFASMGFGDTFKNPQRSKIQTNVTIAATHLPMQTFLGFIWKNVIGKVLTKHKTSVHSHTYVVNSTYNPGTNCLVFITHVCSFTHTCGNNHTYMETATQAGVGFLPHTCGKTHT